MNRKRFITIAKAVYKNEMSNRNAQEYKEYFKEKLDKYDVKSPIELDDDKKDDFFNEVNEDWDAKSESD